MVSQKEQILIKFNNVTEILKTTENVLWMEVPKIRKVLTPKYYQVSIPEKRREQMPFDLSGMHPILMIGYYGYLVVLTRNDSLFSLITVREGYMHSEGKLRIEFERDILGGEISLNGKVSITDFIKVCEDLLPDDLKSRIINVLQTREKYTEIYCSLKELKDNKCLEELDAIPDIKQGDIIESNIKTKKNEMNKL